MVRKKLLNKFASYLNNDSGGNSDEKSEPAAGAASSGAAVDPLLLLRGCPHIQIEILSRLSHTEVCNCRLVSSSWRAIIDSFVLNGLSRDEYLIETWLSEDAYRRISATWALPASGKHIVKISPNRDLVAMVGDWNASSASSSSYTRSVRFFRGQRHLCTTTLRESMKDIYQEFDNYALMQNYFISILKSRDLQIYARRPPNNNFEYSHRLNLDRPKAFSIEFVRKLGNSLVFVAQSNATDSSDNGGNLAIAVLSDYGASARVSWKRFNTALIPTKEARKVFYEASLRYVSIVGQDGSLEVYEHSGRPVPQLVLKERLSNHWLLTLGPTHVSLVDRIVSLPEQLQIALPPDAHGRKPFLNEADVVVYRVRHTLHLWTPRRSFWRHELPTCMASTFALEEVVRGRLLVLVSASKNPKADTVFLLDLETGESRTRRLRAAAAAAASPPLGPADLQGSFWRISDDRIVHVLSTGYYEAFTLPSLGTVRRKGGL